MRNEELIKRIEMLEEENKKQQEVLNFLIEHGKDGVDTEINSCYCLLYKVIKYLYDGELKKVALPHNLDINIVKTNKNEIIFSCARVYHKIDKATATYMQIPEPLFVSKEKEKETKAKKKNANT